jgi:hypothetical protein
MSVLDSFIHGNALSEVLMEGHNPYALQKLGEADADALRQQMVTGERLLAYANGRIVMSGRGVWAVTTQGVVLRDASRVDAQRFSLAEVDSFEAQRGSYGHTIRIRVGGRGWSLFGVDRDLAAAMHQALQAGGVSSQFDDRPTRSPLWRESTPVGQAQDCIQDAQRRLSLA